MKSSFSIAVAHLSEKKDILKPLNTFAKIT